MEPVQRSDDGEMVAPLLARGRSQSRCERRLPGARRAGDPEQKPPGRGVDGSEQLVRQRVDRERDGDLLLPARVCPEIDPAVGGVTVDLGQLFFTEVEPFERGDVCLELFDTACPCKC